MSNTIEYVKNKFKFGGHTFSIVTDDTDNPQCLVSMHALIDLIQGIEPFIGRTIVTGVVDENAHESIPTCEAVYKLFEGLDNRLKAVEQKVNS